ncbi:Virus X resistance protein-like, coiled-coil domain [Sesbania bispinosa]|nr:Virus X resistance protein-like, coiled-coil domain [Sesbania bispinosa]
MAESFVSDVAHSLLGKLASYAYEEASRAYGVYDDLQRFKDTLSIVKGVLLDAEEKKDKKHGLREWLRQIENICYHAEDVLDGFEFQNKRNQVVKASGSTSMKVGHFFSSHNPLVFRIMMAHQIKNVRDRLEKVVADGNRFGLERRIDVDPRLVLQKREMTYSHVYASGMIGREDDMEEIVQLLMQPHPDGDGDGDKSLCVIPIVGIGGLGKTTLAKLVFNDKRMDQLFQLKMWVCVSDDFDIRQIVIKIIKSASASASAPTIAHAHQENINNLDMDQLVSHLTYKLSGQKFLLVLDDIWKVDRAKWIELKDLIKVGAAGSKILVTTRSNSISSMMGTVDPYVLEGLSPENCLSLFVKWAFKEGEEKKYPNLVEIGKEIVKKCHGVPLAVRTLGSSLFTKIDVEKWELIRDSEIWELEQKEDDILPALKLSYDQMPSHLRHCFTYFSLFPKDHDFYVEYVKNLWLALGLLQSQNGSQKTNDIAREYIDELHSRSFIQDFEEFGHNNYSFKVHDLVHDLVVYVANEEFVVVNSHTRNIPEQILFNGAQLNSLEELYVDSCGSLESLPLYILPQLHSLSVGDCKMLKLSLKDESPMGNSQMVQQSVNHENPIQRLRMKNLYLWGFPELETLPQWIEGVADTLHTLKIFNFSNLKMLPEFLTTMTNLKILNIIECPQLLSLPSDMHRLTAHLEELRIDGCPELCRKCLPQCGEYWPIIAHIKRVVIEEPRHEEEK